MTVDLGGRGDLLLPLRLENVAFRLVTAFDELQLAI